MIQADYIIVGGGSAGCVLANRLSANGRYRVVLIEAGPDTPPGAVPEVIADSYTGFSYFDPRYHWTSLRVYNGHPRSNAPSAPPSRFEQARVMGGGSSINGQFAVRGMPGDYDEWAAMGLRGWSFADVLPYFVKLERDCDFAGPLHGREGPIPVRRILLPSWPGFTRAVAEAMETDRHYRVAEDLNADFDDGIFPMPISNEHERRVSTAIGYLDAATRKRSNLRIIPETLVENLVVDGTTVTGVKVRRAGHSDVLWGKEVLVSAGALHTPAILMRAGIGPAHELRRHGIDIRVDLPGVGENLMEHSSISAAAFMQSSARLPSRMRRHIVCGLRYSSAHDGCPPGDMFLMPGNKASWHPLGRRLGTLTLACNKPYARGYVRLASASPDDEPVVALNLAGDGRDLWRLVDGLKLMYALMEAPTVKACTRFWFLSGYSDEVRALAVRRATNWFKTGVAALLLEVGGPPRKILYRRRLANGFDVHAAIRDDEVLADWVRAHVWPGWHPSGTCRMGPDHDPMAVLDPECRVRQVDGLRVVDASVMPTIPRGNTNIPTIMIAEKVADAILGTLTAPDLPTEQVA